MNKEGKRFENNIKKSIPEYFKFLRIPDPAQSFNDCQVCRDKSPIRFSLKNPYDMEIFTGNKLFCLELKSTKATSMSMPNNSDDKKKFIKPHQEKGLYEASLFPNVIAGFLLNFRENDGSLHDEDDTYFISIVDYCKMKKSINKKSFNLKDLMEFNPTKIPSKLLRTNYDYDLSNFFNIEPYQAYSTPPNTITPDMFK